MPPPVKRNIVVILYDLNTKADFQLAAEDFLGDLAVRKWHYGKKDKDIYKLIVLNANHTKNSFDFPNICQYDGVFEFNPFILQNTKCLNPDVANWMDGLTLAANIFQEEFKDVKGIITKQILFVTDFSTTSEPCTDHKVLPMQKLLDKLGIYLYIVGPQISITKTLKNINDIRQFMRTIDESDDNNEIQMAKRLVRNMKNGLMCGLDLADALFAVYRNWVGPQPFLLPLSIGTNLQIPTKCVRYHTKPLTRLPKRQRKSSQLIPTRLPHKPQESWQMTRSTYLLDKLVIFTPDVKDSFKYKGPRFFKLFGFVERSKVPELYLGGDGGAIVLPWESKGRSDVSTVAALAAVLRARGMFAIVRRRYMQNCKAPYFALIPHPSVGCFYMSPLPYAHNKIVEYEEKEAVVEGSDDDDLREKIIFEFLDGIEVSGKQAVLPLAFQLMWNPYYKKIRRLLGKKALKQPLEDENVVFLKLDDPLCVDEDKFDFWPERELRSEKLQKSKQTKTKDIDETKAENSDDSDW